MKEENVGRRENKRVVGFVFEDGKGEMAIELRC